MWTKIKRRLRGWRTIIVGVAAAVLGILDALHAIDITPLLPEGRAGAIMAVLGVVMIVLRFITTGPLGAPAELSPEMPAEENAA